MTKIRTCTKFLSCMLTAVLLLQLPQFCISPVFASLGAGMDTNAVIGEAETMAVEFEENRVAFQEMAEKGGFLAEIGPADASAIEIETVDDLVGIGQDPGKPLSGSYVLTDDIDLSNHNGGTWVSIGYGSGKPFTGNFDGQGHVIKNLTITDISSGLFRHTSGAAIKNLGMVDTDIDISSSSGLGVGAICGSAVSTTISNCYNTGDISVSGGSAGGICGNISGTVNDCYNTGEISAFGGAAGGICAGRPSSSSGSETVIVSNCYNTGNISASDSVFAFAGGICGTVAHVDSESITISDCYNMGNVSSSGSGSGSPSAAGGICGSISGKSPTINNCYNAGDVSNSAFAVGGICGRISGSASAFSTISNCYNKGDVSGLDSVSRVGGICGDSSGSGYSFVSINDCFNTGNVSGGNPGSVYVATGGICGAICAASAVNNCYNTGDVSGSDWVGGICGEISLPSAGSAPSISNCYNTGDVSASDSNWVLAGGICGSRLTTSGLASAISNCYNTGDVSAFSSSGPAYVSGIICGNGPAAYLSVNNCVVLSAKLEAQGSNENNSHSALITYPNDNKFPKSNNFALAGTLAGNPIDDTGNGEGGARINLAQAKEQSTYKNLGWDFENIWKMVEGYPFPQLQWQTTYTDGGDRDADIGDEDNDNSNGDNSNNNGNSGNTGAGGGGSAPAAQTVTSAGGSVSVSHTLSGGNATLSLPDGKVDEVIAKSEDAAVFDLSKISGAAETTLPKTALTKFAEADLALDVKLPQGAVTLSKEAAASAGAQASGAVTVSLKAADSSALNSEQKEIAGDRPVYDVSVRDAGGAYITSFDGGLITVSIPYELKAGEEANGLVVYRLDERGDMQKMETNYDATAKSVVFTTDHLSLYVLAYEEAETDRPRADSFTDVKTSDWFFGDVEYVYANGLMTGTSATAFGLQSKLTRAMLVTTLHRLAASPAASESAAFGDVDEASWYGAAVNWAAENDIVAGVGDGKFAPNDNVTREQIAAILYRYAQRSADGQISGADAAPAFADADKISDWARGAAAWAEKGGIITGKPGNLFDPRGEATRAEAAAMLHRFAETAK